mmetsp:Transcript_78979/g.221388  ORF Transcript_78979/g.221388 Transcript_78979/m.221388 type:complete len:318 (-) Transcript_78979:496-1449(-)
MGVGGGSGAWMKVFCTERPRLPSVEGVSGRMPLVRQPKRLSAAPPSSVAMIAGSSESCAAMTSSGSSEPLLSLSTSSSPGRNSFARLKSLGAIMLPAIAYGDGVGGKSVRAGVMDRYAGSELASSPVDVDGAPPSLQVGVVGVEASSSKQRGCGRERPLGAAGAGAKTSSKGAGCVAVLAAASAKPSPSTRLMRLRAAGFREGTRTWPDASSFTVQRSRMRGSCKSSDNLAWPRAVSLSSTPKRDWKSRLRFDSGTVPSAAAAASSRICCKDSRKASQPAVPGASPPAGTGHRRWLSACCSFNMDCERAYGTSVPSE